MIMADVFAVFGTLLAVGIALPGLLLTWRLLLPQVVERGEQRLHDTPWQCFFAGGFAFAAWLLPVIILFNLPWSFFKLLGFISLFILFAVTSIGAAGLAGLMGRRMQKLGGSMSNLSATIRGSIALELAAVFPLIGWFIFIPLAFITTLGAAVFALLHWIPRPKSVTSQTSPMTEVG